MLARKVTANIYGKLANNLYSGYANIEDKSRRAIIFTKKPVNDVFYGIVIAIVTPKNGDAKIIVSSENEVYYQPDIMKALSALKSFVPAKIICLYEKSCGAVIFRKNKNDVKLLLVKNHNGRHWSFPKGHIEENETEEETAIREIKEETNLDVKIMDNFREVSSYCPFGKIRKEVVFFLARTVSDNIKLQESEIDSFLWVDIDGAKKLCSYENDFNLIDKADSYIKRFVK